MVAGFGYLCQYVERLTFMFMYKVTSKIRFDVLFGGGGGFMKNVAVTSSVPKSIYGLPLTGNHYFLFQGSFRSSHQRCSAKKLFLRVFQYTQVNTYAGVSFKSFETFKNTYFEEHL